MASKERAWSGRDYISRVALALGPTGQFADQLALH